MKDGEIMIPKIIHTCWFGPDPMPERYINYINGWKKINPDYEIKIWSYKDFEPYFGDSEYIKDALSNKKWAFAADYFRWKVLYEFGGIYADSDIEMLKPLDDFLNSKIFSGFMYDCLIEAELVGAEPGNPIIRDWLNTLITNYDKNKEFVVLNNWITEYFLNNFDDFLLNGKEQHLKCGIDLYPKDYFERIKISKKSKGGYAIHHCDGSWHKNKKKNRLIFKFIPKKLLEIYRHKKCLKNSPFYKRYLLDKRK